MIDLASPWSRQPQEAAPALLQGPLRVPAGSFVWHPPRGVNVDRDSRLGTASSTLLTPNIGTFGKYATGGSNRRTVWPGSLFASSAAYTVIAVVLDNSGRSAYRNPFDGDNVDGNRVFRFRFTNGNVAEFIPFNTSGTPFTVTGSTVTSSDNPSVMVGRVDANKGVTVWLNGRLEASDTMSGTVATLSLSSTYLAIGASAQIALYADSFTGQILQCLYLPYAVADSVLASLRSDVDVYRALYQPTGLWLPLQSAGASSSVFNPLSGRGGAAAQPVIHH